MPALPEGVTAAPPGHPPGRRWLVTWLGGAATLALSLAAAPAAAQWRAGQSPGAGVATNAATLEGYALMLQASEERLRTVLAQFLAHGTREPQEGAMPPAQQALLDEAQTALVVVRNAPDAFRDRAVYEATERELRESLVAMSAARTPPPAAAAEARQILEAMARLRQSVAAASRDAGAGGGPSR